MGKKLDFHQGNRMQSEVDCELQYARSDIAPLKNSTHIS